MSDITIILPAYHEKIDIISQSLDSILNQTFSDFQVFVILDDPGNYELKNYILNRAKIDSRIYLFVNEENLGLAKSLNKMIQKVSTKYIARMDADDIADTRRIERQYKFMEENPNIDLCGTNIVLINSEGDFVKKNAKIPTTHEKIARCLKYKNCMSHPTYFAKTGVMKDVRYRGELRYAQDYDFVCRCVEQGYTLANIDEYLLRYRITELSAPKLLRQSLISYFVRKNFKHRTLSKNESISSNVDDYIREKGEEGLLLSVSTSKTLRIFCAYIKTGKLKSAISIVKYILPPMYKISTWIDLKIYNVILHFEC